NEDTLRHLLSVLHHEADTDPLETKPEGDEHGNQSSILDQKNDLPLAQATRRFQLARKIVVLNCHTILREMIDDPRLTSSESKDIAFKALTSYCAGAVLFPYHKFLKDAQRSLYDVEYLAQLYGGSFEQIAHRLVTLRAPATHGIPFGFLRTDPSGFLTKQFPLPGLLMPNAGHACPLWVIYRSAQSPNQVMRQIVSFTDGSRYLFIAKTSIKRVETFNNTSVFSTVMLACNLIQADQTTYATSLRLDQPEYDTPVGPACNLCTRQQCTHRNTPMAAAQLN
ncbi:MAG: short-chain fatty acyl-CoA regulator family protein, partial [Devosiaceae bacterium]|nr:short-chain fatty acyl-CoA regulator family protein [Devosiaceae bacterium]